MKSFISKLSVLFAAFLCMAACEKNDSSNPVVGDVEIYLLESYETLENSMQINESTAVLKPDAFIAYPHIVSYKKSTHTFVLTDEMKVQIKDIDISLHTQAFAVTANKKIVYTGYFWYGFSSSICDWICIDPIMIDLYEGLNVNLGYPGLMDNMVIPDRRNDSQILNIFQRDNKLEN